MITQERLKELIEQGATIYKISKEIFIAGASDFLKIVEVPSGLYSQEINDRLGCQPDYSLLFETKEDAEWQLEFVNIPRTEILNLPTWGEAQKNLEVEIYAPKGRKYLLQTKIKVGYSIDKENPYIIRIDRIGYADSQIDFEYSKENYIEACRVAKKLFLGEE